MIFFFSFGRQVLKLMPLDQYSIPAAIMQKTANDKHLVLPIIDRFRDIFRELVPVPVQMEEVSEKKRKNISPFFCLIIRSGQGGAICVL